MAKLEEYRRKRDFRKTREPAGDDSADSSSGERYVMHKHAASHDHFDLRLEQDGVLKSWALPKGPSLEPGEKRLAVEVEDHPLDYGDFEGVIPKKSYGGGTVMLWDRGRWQPTGKRNKNRIDFTLDGEKLRGAWTLTRMAGGKQKSDKNWLLIKRHDDEDAHDQALEIDDQDRSVASGRTMSQIAEDVDNIWQAKASDERSQDDRRSGNDSDDREHTPAPSQRVGELKGARRQALPKEANPQLATLVDRVPQGTDWIHEVKFDGYRIMVRFDHGEVRLITRNNKDWTHRFPEFARRMQQLPVEQALLDGEIVALHRDGVSSFRRLQEALSAGDTRRLTYQAFDLLHLDGYDLTGVALSERKRALAELLEAAGFDNGGHIRYSDHIDAQGETFYEHACRLGLEGIISKRASSHYRSTRSKQWLKVKCANHEEFVIGGYTEPGGSRSGFGALLMGVFDDQNRLVYAGRVGTGFNKRLLETLSATLRDLETSESPFAGSVPNSRGVHWVRPEQVIEVEFAERTRDGLLRHPAFRGLREDRNPEEIRMASDTDESTTPPRSGKTSGSDESGESKAAASRGQRNSGSSSSRSGQTTQVLGVRLTHADRVLYPEQGLTKLGLARYYEEIQDWVMPHLARRPLALMRCPEGRDGECFFQKHPRVAIPDSVPRIDIEEKKGTSEYLYVESAADLIALVQAGALEIHPWGSRVGDLERPDNLVFDLDPAPGVSWPEIIRVARSLRERLASLGLESFVRVTGGKGLHLVVPIEPGLEWDDAKAFAKALAQQEAKADPKRLTTNMSKSQREGRIFIDYLRNGRGATAVASYTVRAREGATVCAPVRWDELDAKLKPDRYTVSNLPRRLASLREDPWAGFDDSRRAITAKMRRAVGLD
ncbi:DNA ligase D [Halomonas sp. HP20-15]|uniref:DNA ligase D n=1 Tax=Halomonas sp. HP20-15 TaxID=3085901 RepID=UPI00298107B6|nr:DNA ligase D [Halomonas sp. HP20-15]MDW5375647.1 DNA ligase D [Halomonas sp. HP20-15]